MPDDHGHDTAGHSHGAGSNARQLSIALALTGSFLIAELVGAYLYNSLALLSDAAHMLTDAAALAIALIAIKVGQRPPDDQRTYGYRRFEILAAAFNAVLLFVVAGYILFEGIGRFFSPEPVQSIGMFVVAMIGLFVNFAAMRVLADGKDDSPNVKGAYLEVWADMLGSLGVIGAATVIYFTNWTWVDPVVAIAIGLWVLPRTWILLRDTTHILLQGVPRGIDLEEVRAAIAGVEGVVDIHDLHLWSVAGDDKSLTVHVGLASEGDAHLIRTAIATMLMEQFAIDQSTIQTEVAPCVDRNSTHS